MDILTSIGELSVDEFMRRHWQRRPLLARKAFAHFSSPIEPAQLFAMAASDEVDSRLVSAFNGRWALQRGPIPRLPARRQLVRLCFGRCQSWGQRVLNREMKA